MCNQMLKWAKKPPNIGISDLNEQLYTQKEYDKQKKKKRANLSGVGILAIQQSKPKRQGKLQLAKKILKILNYY